MPAVDSAPDGLRLGMANARGVGQIGLINAIQLRIKGLMDKSEGRAMSYTTEPSLRDSIITYHVYPTTPLRSMAGYFQHALTGSDWGWRTQEGLVKLD